ncbi:HDOD domain-containing protein [Pseudomonas sp. Ga0074129]|uniref:HDOD domain-containing protein n=1 Tax=Pseudomonas sp. Ga0074129 TaxID=1752219 RepID=UPI000B043C52|nr:HDOD domain-containing protein [Pseudomonas sp. Ga0074129]
MEISALFSQVHSLPCIPKVAQDLIQQFDNPHTSIDNIARNISLDPVIAAKVLRLANSARFRGSRESASVEDAAMRLGFNTLRTLVLASAVTGAFQAPPGFDLKGFWGHSFQVASISRLLAKTRGVAVEIAFTCGMMHNIGELLIQTGVPQLAERLNQNGKDMGAAQRVALETLQLGFGFPEVGAELARLWQLPELIQHAIAYQSRPTQAPADMPLPRVLAQAVSIAEALREYPGDMNKALETLQGPLFDGLDVASLLDELPAVLEADKGFAELLG